MNCVSYNTKVSKILAHYLQTVYYLEMTWDILDNLNHQMFQYNDDMYKWAIQKIVF